MHTSPPVPSLSHEIRHLIATDHSVLTDLRQAVRPLLSHTRPIHPQAATAISLVAADGGNNQVQFDPFLIQLVRVVDSNHNEYTLEAISPHMDRGQLDAKHHQTPLTPLGRMMQLLGVDHLWELSPMIPAPRSSPPPPTWVQAYRDLTEWAVLLCLVHDHHYGSDTVLLKDGLLRSKVFAGHLFARLRELLEGSIESAYASTRRRLYLVGVAKRSKVLQLYRLAMALEKVMHNTYACQVQVPGTLEKRAYQWVEYARGDDLAAEEAEKFVAGRMYFAKFGSHPLDPIWPVDVLLGQVEQAPVILGHLLADAREGFPIPHYPLCLQRAHEKAAMVDFDLAILQNEILGALRASLAEGVEREALEGVVFLDRDRTRK